MSETTTPNMTALRITSVHVMSIQYTATIVLAVVGLVSLMVSMLQMLIILLWQPLRTKQQILVFNVALGDALKSITITVPTFRRLYFIWNGMDGVTDQLSCVLWYLLANVSMNYAFPIILSLSVERCLSICAPVWHRNYDFQLKIYSTIVSAGIAVTVSCISLSGASRQTMNTDCTNLASLPPMYVTLRENYQNVFIALILAVNLITILVLLHRYRTAMRAKQSMNAFKRSIELEAVKTLAILLVIFFASLVSTWIYLQLATIQQWSVEKKTTLSPIGGILTLLRGCFDGLVYFIFSADYRRAFGVIFLRRQLGSKVTTVTPMHTNHSLRHSTFHNADLQSKN